MAKRQKIVCTVAQLWVLWAKDQSVDRRIPSGFLFTQGKSVWIQHGSHKHCIASLESGRLILDTWCALSRRNYVPYKYRHKDEHKDGTEVIVVSGVLPHSGPRVAADKAVHMDALNNITWELNYALHGRYKDIPAIYASVLEEETKANDKLKALKSRLRIDIASTVISTFAEGVGYYKLAGKRLEF